MGIVGGPNLDIANIVSEIIDPMGNRFTGCQGRPVMVIDLYGGLSIGVSGSVK